VKNTTILWPNFTTITQDVIKVAGFELIYNPKIIFRDHRQQHFSSISDRQPAAYRGRQAELGHQLERDEHRASATVGINHKD
jgi:hypothetical protein